MLRQFPIYDAPNLPEYGTAEARIEVGRWGTIYPSGGSGSVFKGKRIIAYGCQGQEIYRETLHSQSRWVADEKNHLGTLGAVRFDPPTSEEVDAAIERARRALVAEANLLETAPPLRPGWSEWIYSMPIPPYREAEHPQQGVISTTMRGSGTDDEIGNSFAVTGRDSRWKAETDSLTSGGQLLYYSNETYPTAETAMIACENAAKQTSAALW